MSFWQALIWTSFIHFIQNLDGSKERVLIWLVNQQKVESIADMLCDRIGNQNKIDHLYQGLANNSP